MKLEIKEKTSKNNKTYYGIFIVKGDYEILLKFISKKQFEELTK